MLRRAGIFSNAGFVFRKWTAGFTAGLFLFTIAAEGPAQASVWEDRRAAFPAGAASPSSSLLDAPPLRALHGSDDLAAPSPSRRDPLLAPLSGSPVLELIPSSSVVIQEVHWPAGATKFVLHLQDVHGHREAQENISKAILFAQKSIDRRAPGARLTVALEGAAGPFVTDVLRSFPGKDALERVSRAFMEKDLFTGAEYAALTAPVPPLLWGVETPQLYRDHVAAVRAGFRREQALKDVLDGLSRRLSVLKEKNYTEPLKTWDRASAAYHDGQDGLGAYVKLLQAGARRGAYPMLDRFMDALSREESLDFKRAERERKSFIEALAAALPRTDLESLMRESLAFRAGKLTYVEFHETLSARAAKAGLSLTAYPAFNAYVRYVKTVETVDRRGLLEELSRREDDAVAALTASLSPAARETFDAAADLASARKTLEHALTPAEWARCAPRLERIHRLPARLSALESAAPSGPDAGLAEPLAPFEDFYRVAQLRNRALVDNLLSKMDETAPAAGLRTAVLVAGGFHSDGVAALLREKGVAYVVAAPRIEKTGDAGYLDVFREDRTPLDRLFKSEKVTIVDELGGARDGMLPGGRPAEVPSMASGALAAASPVDADAARTIAATFGAVLGERREGGASLFDVRSRGGDAMTFSNAPFASSIPMDLGDGQSIYVARVPRSLRSRAVAAAGRGWDAVTRSFHLAKGGAGGLRELPFATRLVLAAAQIAVHAAVFTLLQGFLPASAMAAVAMPVLGAGASFSTLYLLFNPSSVLPGQFLEEVDGPASLPRATPPPLPAAARRTAPPAPPAAAFRAARVRGKGPVGDSLDYEKAYHDYIRAFNENRAAPILTAYTDAGLYETPAVTARWTEQVDRWKSKNPDLKYFLTREAKERFFLELKTSALKALVGRESSRYHPATVYEDSAAMQRFLKRILGVEGVFRDPGEALKRAVLLRMELLGWPEPESVEFHNEPGWQGLKVSAAGKTFYFRAVVHPVENGEGFEVAWLSPVGERRPVPGLDEGEPLIGGEDRGLTELDLVRMSLGKSLFPRRLIRNIDIPARRIQFTTRVAPAGSALYEEVVETPGRSTFSGRWGVKEGGRIDVRWVDFSVELVGGEHHAVLHGGSTGLEAKDVPLPEGIRIDRWIWDAARVAETEVSPPLSAPASALPAADVPPSPEDVLFPNRVAYVRGSVPADGGQVYFSPDFPSLVVTQSPSVGGRAVFVVNALGKGGLPGRKLLEFDADAGLKSARLSYVARGLTLSVSLAEGESRIIDFEELERLLEEVQRDVAVGQDLTRVAKVPQGAWDHTPPPEDAREIKSPGVPPVSTLPSRETLRRRIFGGYAVVGGAKEDPAAPGRFVYDVTELSRVDGVRSTMVRVVESLQGDGTLRFDVEPRFPEVAAREGGWIEKEVSFSLSPALQSYEGEDLPARVRTSLRNGTPRNLRAFIAGAEARVREQARETVVAHVAGDVPTVVVPVPAEEPGTTGTDHPYVLFEAAQDLADLTVHAFLAEPATTDELGAVFGLAGSPSPAEEGEAYADLSYGAPAVLPPSAFRPGPPLRRRSRLGRAAAALSMAVVMIFTYALTKVGTVSKDGLPLLGRAGPEAAGELSARVPASPEIVPLLSPPSGAGPSRAPAVAWNEALHPAAKRKAAAPSRKEKKPPSVESAEPAAPALAREVPAPAGAAPRMEGPEEAEPPEEPVAVSAAAAPKELRAMAALAQALDGKIREVIAGGEGLRTVYPTSVQLSDGNHFPVAFLRKGEKEVVIFSTLEGWFSGKKPWVTVSLVDDDRHIYHFKEKTDSAVNIMADNGSEPVGWQRAGETQWNPFPESAPMAKVPAAPGAPQARASVVPFEASIAGFPGSSWPGLLGFLLLSTFLIPVRRALRSPRANERFPEPGEEFPIEFWGDAETFAAQIQKELQAQLPPPAPLDLAYQLFGEALVAPRETGGPANAFTIHGLPAHVRFTVLPSAGGLTEFKVVDGSWNVFSFKADDEGQIFIPVPGHASWRKISAQDLLRRISSPKMRSAWGKAPADALKEAGTVLPVGITANYRKKEEISKAFSSAENVREFIFSVEPSVLFQETALPDGTFEVQVFRSVRKDEPNWLLGRKFRLTKRFLVNEWGEKIRVRGHGARQISGSFLVQPLRDLPPVSSGPKVLVAAPERPSPVKNLPRRRATAVVLAAAAAVALAWGAVLPHFSRDDKSPFVAAALAARPFAPTVEPMNAPVDAARGSARAAAPRAASASVRRGRASRTASHRPAKNTVVPAVKIEREPPAREEMRLIQPEDLDVPAPAAPAPPLKEDHAAEEAIAEGPAAAEETVSPAMGSRIIAEGDRTLPLGAAAGDSAEVAEAPSPAAPPVPPSGDDTLPLSTSFPAASIDQKGPSYLTSFQLLFLLGMTFVGAYAAWEAGNLHLAYKILAAGAAVFILHEAGHALGYFLLRKARHYPPVKNAGEKGGSFPRNLKELAGSFKKIVNEGFSFLPSLGGVGDAWTQVWGLAVSAASVVTGAALFLSTPGHFAAGHAGAAWAVFSLLSLVPLVPLERHSDVRRAAGLFGPLLRRFGDAAAGIVGRSRLDGVKRALGPTAQDGASGDIPGSVGALIAAVSPPARRLTALFDPVVERDGGYRMLDKFSDHPGLMEPLSRLASLSLQAEDVPADGLQGLLLGARRALKDLFLAAPRTPAGVRREAAAVGLHLAAFAMARANQRAIGPRLAFHPDLETGLFLPGFVSPGFDPVKAVVIQVDAGTLVDIAGGKDVPAVGEINALMEDWRALPEAGRPRLVLMNGDNTVEMAAFLKVLAEKVPVLKTLLMARLVESVQPKQAMGARDEGGLFSAEKLAADVLKAPGAVVFTTEPGRWAPEAGVIPLFRTLQEMREEMEKLRLVDAMA